VCPGVVSEQTRSAGLGCSQVFYRFVLALVVHIMRLGTVLTGAL
jgi:hypothetical protein